MKMKNTTCCTTTIIAAVLAILKLCGAVKIHWGIIIGIWLAPIAIAAIVIIFAAIFAIIVKFLDRRHV